MINTHDDIPHGTRPGRLDMFPRTDICPPISTHSPTPRKNSPRRNCTFSAVRLLTLFSHSPSPVHVRTLSREPPSTRRIRVSFRIKEGFDTARKVSGCAACGRRGRTEGTCQGETCVSGADDDDVVGVFFADLRDRGWFRRGCGVRCMTPGDPWGSTGRCVWQGKRSRPRRAGEDPGCCGSACPGELAECSLSRWC